MASEQEEQNFLNNYDPTAFARVAVTTDLLVFSVSDEPAINYRKTDRKRFELLLVQRDDFPFKDSWCLPGGFLNSGEEITESARKVLARETNLAEVVYLEQLGTFGEVNRDPRMRVVSTAYLSLLDRTKINQEQLAPHAAWFEVLVDESKKNEVNITFKNQEKTLTCQLQKQLLPKSKDQYQYTILHSDLAFDHALLIAKGLERLKNKLTYTDLAFELLADTFTLNELQQVYEAILHKKLLKPVFRRTVLTKVSPTSQTATGRGHRPASLYRYRNEE